jgi:hypothetical protein
MTTLTLPVLLLFCLLSFSVAFAPVAFTRQVTASARFSTPGDDAVVDSEEEEHKKKVTYFAALLRDLQVEGVPLLGCDADEVHTLQAALWTTMAELTNQDDANSACMILENIPLAALQMFVDDFLTLKNQLDQMEHLPELNRVTTSLVGKGIGPAILIEVAAKTEEAPIAPYTPEDEFKCSAAMKVFMERVVVGGDGPASIGLGDEGSAEPIVYRSGFTTSVCATVAGLWNCVCEMQMSQDAGTICLMLPSIASSHDQFESVAQLLSRSLCLYQGDSVFSLVHFHPEYDRSTISPVDKPAFGHLPPVSWLRPMLKSNGDSTEIDDEALSKSNYQRRAPMMAVNIVRNSLLGAPKIVTIELDGGATTQASGLEVYCRNTLKLASTDEAVLKAALDAEIAIL